MRKLTYQPANINKNGGYLIESTSIMVFFASLVNQKKYWAPALFHIDRSTNVLPDPNGT